jgi:hypothetical protein
MQRFFLPLLALLVLAGLIWYAVAHPITPSAGTTDTSGEVLDSYSEEGPYYTIEGNYPKSAELAKNDASAVALMKNYVEERVAQFKRDGDFEGLTPEDTEARGFDEGRKSSLLVSYLVSQSPHTRSYIFTIYEDMGGAHGNTYFKTFVFDPTEGIHLDLEDVFTPEAGYLIRLSEIARRELPTLIGEYADQEFITTGTEPTEENFANFFFDTDSFVLLFPPYQVGPYALGPVTLRIPAAELKDILKSSYP